MYKIVHEEPEGLEELKKLLPPSLPRILEKMLKKDLSERFQTLDEAADALEDVQASLTEEDAAKAGKADRRGPAMERPEPAVEETILAGEGPPSLPLGAPQKHRQRAKIAVYLLGALALASVVLFLFRHFTQTPTGTVALNVLPWAQVAKIEREKEGPLAPDGTSFTPCLLRLPEGSYTITCSHPDYTRPMVLKCVVRRDSLTELSSQWPGFDAEKALSQFSM